MYDATMEELNATAKQLTKLSQELHKLSSLFSRELKKEKDNESLKKEFKDASEADQNNYYQLSIELGYDVSQLEIEIEDITSRLDALGVLKYGEKE